MGGMAPGCLFSNPYRCSESKMLSEHIWDKLTKGSLAFSQHKTVVGLEMWETPQSGINSRAYVLKDHLPVLQSVHWCLLWPCITEGQCALMLYTPQINADHCWAEAVLLCVPQWISRCKSIICGDCVNRSLQTLTWSFNVHAIKQIRLKIYFYRSYSCL